MNSLVSVLGVTAVLCAITAGMSREAAAADDGRIREVEYAPNQVVKVYAEPGVATHIVLGEQDRIVAAGTGANSHCEDPSAAWCVVAVKGERDIYLNPHALARSTNLFVKTAHRNYSFDLVVLRGRDLPRMAATYRLEFSFPDDRLAATSALLSRAKEADRTATLASRLRQTDMPMNWNYTKQAMPGGEDIAPTMMYDDGRFTYLRFPNNREFPTIFKVASDNSESIVQFHVKGDIMVVHEVARRFVLRDGAAVVGLWNEAYDPDGIPPVGGTTIEGVTRTVVPDTTVIPTRATGPGVTADSRGAHVRGGMDAADAVDPAPVLLHQLEQKSLK